MIASVNAGKQNRKGKIKGVISLFEDRIGQSAGGIYYCGGIAFGLTDCSKAPEEILRLRLTPDPGLPPVLH